MINPPIQIGYYVCLSKKGRNAERPIIVLIDDVSWPINVKRMRGILGNRVFLRSARPDEIDAHEGSRRLMSYRYISVNDLVADEERVGTSPSNIHCIRTRIIRFLGKDHPACVATPTSIPAAATPGNQAA